MDRILIEGGTPLHGTLAISGSKNAVLPLMVAGLLTDQPVTLRGTPRLADTRTLANVLRELGAEVEEFGNGPGEGVRVHAHDLSSVRAPYELVSKMRASFWVLGPLLARARKAEVSLPGGCAIGTRPVDLYLSGLAKMGADIAVEGGYVIAAARGGLKGARIDLPFVSVGATHVLMMAATLAEGKTTITNAASEPEIVDVGRCLQQMGAQIDGLGTRTVHITGVQQLGGADHTVSRDRIEAGAYALAVAASGGAVDLTGITGEELGALLPAMRLAGVQVAENGTDTQPALRVSARKVDQMPRLSPPNLIRALPPTCKLRLWGLCAAPMASAAFAKRFLKIVSCMFRNWCGWVPIFRWKATRPLLQVLTRFTARPSWRPICALPSRW